MILTSEALLIANEIVSLAGTDTTLTEYKQDSLLRKIELGTSHDDRLRMIEFLLHEGLIRTKEDKVQVIKGTIPDWIVDFASQGYSEAFSLVEILNPLETWGVNKFDESVLKQIGLQGEMAFIEHLNTSAMPPIDILHVSLFDDTLGYDVRTTDRGGRISCYEVKTSSRPASSRFQFFLSRNEYETSVVMKEWKLACMQITAGRAQFIGFSPSEFIQTTMPRDTGAETQWAVAKVKIPISKLGQF
jgi:hypothetical protein